MFIDKVNLAFVEKGAFFKLGKNFYWIELHLNSMLGKSIEVIYSAEYTEANSVKLFNPVVSTATSSTNKVFTKFRFKEADICMDEEFEHLN